MPDQEASLPTLLLFADISGYTGYIRDNPYSEAHALGNISRLLDTVISVLEPAFSLAKLEGDAALCFAPGALVDEPARLNRLLDSLFLEFDLRKRTLLANNTCQCQSCATVGVLELKVILHAGTVLHYQSRLGLELGGSAVILLHRLAKNAVPVPRYLLWTETLDQAFSTLSPVAQYRQACDGLGDIPVQVYSSLPEWKGRVHASAWGRFKDHLVKGKAWWWLQIKGVPGRSLA